MKKTFITCLMLSVLFSCASTSNFKKEASKETGHRKLYYQACAVFSGQMKRTELDRIIKLKIKQYKKRGILFSFRNLLIEASEYPETAVTLKTAKKTEEKAKRYLKNRAHEIHKRYNLPLYFGQFKPQRILFISTDVTTEYKYIDGQISDFITVNYNTCYIIGEVKNATFHTDDYSYRTDIPIKVKSGIVAIRWVYAGENSIDGYFYMRSKGKKIVGIPQKWGNIFFHHMSGRQRQFFGRSKIRVLFNGTIRRTPPICFFPDKEMKKHSDDSSYTSELSKLKEYKVKYIIKNIMLEFYNDKK